MAKKNAVKESSPLERSGQILDAATKFFSRDGYRLTDVQDIADKLKLGKGTVYRHFKSKRKLFTSIIERGMQRLVAEIHSKIEGAGNPLERLELAIMAHLDFFERNKDLIELFMHERSEFKDHFKPLYLKYYQEHQKRIEYIIKECVQKKLVKPVEPRGVASVLTDLYYGVLFTAYLGEGKNSLQQKGRYIIDIFLKNMMTGARYD
ncbi:MAG: TetR/AcrR family transcriptional regulator [Planctomycetes bacterium]|nr:TetR/AcrR family transcriptional regulator [Planctomycetota bacterium]